MFCQKKIERNFCICRLNIQIKTINLKFKFLSNSTCDNKSNTIINLQILVLCLMSDNISHARLCLPTQNKRRKKKYENKFLRIKVICCFFLWLGIHFSVLIQPRTIIYKKKISFQFHGITLNLPLSLYKRGMI